MTHVHAGKLRIAAALTIGLSLLAAAAPTLATSPFLASWVWIG